MSAFHVTVKLATRVLEAAITLVAVVYLALGAGLLTLRYAVLPNLQQFVPWIERTSSQALGLPVHVGRARASWHGLMPTVALDNLVIDDPQGKPALRFASVQALPSWESLVQFQPRFAQLVVRGADLQVRRTDTDHVSVGGIVIDLRASGGDSGQRFADWLFAQDQVLVQDSSVTWTDSLRGAPPVTLSGVDIELRNGLLSHRAAVRATPPAALGAPFELRADLRQPLFARHRADFARWHGQIWASLPRVDLGELARRAPLPAGLLGGSGAIQAWVGIDPDYTVRDVDALVDARDLGARLDRALPPLELRRVAGRVDYRPEPGGQAVTLSGVRLVTADGLTLPALDLRFDQHLDRGRTVGSLRSGAVDIASLAALAHRLPLAGDWRARLEALRPRGQVGGIDAAWRSGSAAQPATWNATASFRGLGWDATRAAVAGLPAGLPGLDGLSGSVRANQNGGDARLTLARGGIDLPTVFETPRLALDSATTDLSWSRGPDGRWSVQTSRLSLANADAAGSASLRYVSGPGQGTLDLSGQLTRASARAVPTYLPLGIDPGLRRYLRAAIGAGTSSDVRFEVHGPLASFPFDRPGSGVFDIQARIEGGAFAPDPLHAGNGGPPWPGFTAINGAFDFTGRGWKASGVSAVSGGLRLQQVALSMPTYDHAVLGASGLVQGQARDALRWVHDSPVEAMLGGVLRRSQAHGPVQARLNLSLPVDTPDRTTVSGSVVLPGDEVIFPPLPRFERVNGRVDFTETGFRLDLTAGNFLGGPTRLSGSMASGRGLRLDASGSVDARAMAAAPELAELAPLLRRMHGRSAVTATITQAPGAAAPRLRVLGDLQGMAVDLPAPLGKPADQSQRFVYEDDAVGTDRHAVSAALGSVLRARLTLGADGAPPEGAIAVGAGAALPTAGAGLRVAVALPSLDVDAWTQALGDGGNTVGSGGRAADAPAAASPPMPDALSLKVGTLQAGGHRVENLSLDATRRGRVWQGTVSSTEAAGSIGWNMGAPGSPGSISARLSRLRLTRVADREARNLAEHEPRSMPALDISARNVDLDGRHFDRLAVHAINRHDGDAHLWRIDRFSLEAPEGTLSGTGEWTVPDREDQPSRTAIGFQLDIADAGGLLDRLGKPGLLKGGRGQIAGTVTWPGAPLAPDFKELSGAFKLGLGRGQFLKADPGIAKLLGVLSLQSLPRRLTLNFSDLFESGFAFDKVAADVQMFDGVATTHDFKMNGVSATVFLDGSADLARETQDLYAVVVPEINAGSASLAYAFVNPAVGLATFLAQYIAREPLMRALAFGYRITGNWAHPEVREVPVPHPSASSPAAAH